MQISKYIVRNLKKIFSGTSSKKMKLIEEFYCIQKEIQGNGDEILLSEGINRIRTELIRPEIFLLVNGTKIKFGYSFNKSLKENPFSPEELFFFEKHYNIKLTNTSGLTTDNSSVNQLYNVPANVILFEDTKSNKNYLLIEFHRWQYEFQPRGAGEDSLGEDVTYIHGIWKNPLLTDAIIEKIKSK